MVKLQKLDVGGSFLGPLPAEVVQFRPNDGEITVYVGRTRSAPHTVNILLGEDGYPQVVEIRSSVPFVEDRDEGTYWMGLRKAAQLLSLDVKTARKLAASGKLRAEMVNGSWMTTREWLAEYAANRRKRGRPKRTTPTEATSSP